MRSFKRSYFRLKGEYICRRYKIDGVSRSVLWELKGSGRVELADAGRFLLDFLSGTDVYEKVFEAFKLKYKNLSAEIIEQDLANILGELESRKVIEVSKKPFPLRSIPSDIDMRGLLNTIYFRLTDACNLNCLHCSVDANSKGQYLGFSDVMNLIDQVHNMMVPAIYFTGGEPTLFKKLQKLISYTRDRYIVPGLLTNGLIISDSYAQGLVESGLATVNISLDGASTVSHDRFRGYSGAFKKALEAIGIFKKLDIHVETTTVINSYNYQEIEEIIELVKSLGVNTIKIIPVIPFKRGRSCDYNFSLKQYEANIKSIGSLVEEGEVFNKEFDKSSGSENFSRCDAGTSVLSINYDGNVLPCNNFHTISLGNIKDKPLLDIYNGSNKILNVESAITIAGSECESCGLLKYCHGGCAMVSYSYFERYDRCDVTRKILIENYLKENLPAVSER